MLLVAVVCSSPRPHTIASHTPSLLLVFRLSPSCKISEPHELKTGDILKLGVDVIEHETTAHKSVTLKVFVSVPAADEREDAKGQYDTSVPLPVLVAQGKDAMAREITGLREANEAYCTQLQELTSSLNELAANERSLSAQLHTISTVLNEVCDCPTRAIRALFTSFLSMVFAVRAHANTRHMYTHVPMHQLTAHAFCRTSRARARKVRSFSLFLSHTGNEYTVLLSDQTHAHDLRRWTRRQRELTLEYNKKTSCCLGLTRWSPSSRST